MSTQIADYLTKQVLIDKNVITYRSLSRHFKIHVNTAKNEIAAFYASLRSSKEPAYATYLLSGDVLPEFSVKHSDLQDQESGMETDDNIAMYDEGDDEEGDMVPVMKITLAGEQDLEAAKAAYLRIRSEHIYCLSPSPITDADLVCGPTQQIHKTDEKLSEDTAASLGRIVGPHVRRGKYVKPIGPAKSVEHKPMHIEKRRVDEEAKGKGTGTGTGTGKTEAMSEAKADKAATSVKPKPSGKLDWSKAKPKGGATAKTKVSSKGKGKADDTVETEVDEKPIEAKKTTSSQASTKLSQNGTASSTKIKVEKVDKLMKQALTLKDSLPSDQETKRPKKRKSALPSDSDSDNEPPRSRKRTPTSPPAQTAPPTGAILNGKKKIILSDEDAAPGLRRKVTNGKSKGKASGTTTSPPVQTAPQTGATLNGKKKVILSDDEDAAPVPRRRVMKGKSKSKTSDIDLDFDAEMSVRAMMDIDDDHVIKVSTKQERQREVPSEPEDQTTPEPEPSQASEDVTMIDVSDDEPEKKPRKRKAKKAWPKGQNGLKKRRIMKSRMTTDEKGYMVTEDYSEYESVDEEEAEEEESKPKRSTAKSKKSATPTEERKPIRASDSDSQRKSKAAEKLKRSGSAGGNKNAQGSLKNFFGKK